MNFGVLARFGPTMRNLRTPRHAEATVDRFNGAGARSQVIHWSYSIASCGRRPCRRIVGCDSYTPGSLGADPRQVTVFDPGKCRVCRTR